MEGFCYIYMNINHITLMITENNIGINLGFANNRFPEPEVWTRIINEVGVKNVQFVADILNPMLKMYDPVYFDRQIEKTIECAKENDINITSMMTSSFTRVNHFSHPDQGYRTAWYNWFIDFLKMGKDFGAKSAGSHFGILTTNSLKEYDFFYKMTVEYWHDLARSAKEMGYEYLFVEPMSIDREFGNTIEKTEKLLEDLKDSEIPIKLCLDLGHAPHPDCRDYKEWLERFAKDSPIIHLQQTVLNSSNHSPFTKHFNDTGIIKSDEVLDILNQHNSSPELVLELSFREKHEVEPTIITDLKESVDYWKNAINKFNN